MAAKGKRLSDKQRTALLAAYSDELSCVPDLYGGPHPRTVATLVKAGLLRPGDDEPDDHALTAEGEKALGIAEVMAAGARTPLEAVRAAAGLFADGQIDVLSPDEHTGPQPDEGESDWSDVVAWLSFEGLSDDGDEVIEAIATLTTRLGFSVYAEGVRDGLVAVWREA